MKYTKTLVAHKKSCKENVERIQQEKNLISTQRQNKAVAGVIKSLNKMEQTGAFSEVMYAMMSSLTHKAAGTASG